MPPTTRSAKRKADDVAAPSAPTKRRRQQQPTAGSSAKRKASDAGPSISAPKRRRLQPEERSYRGPAPSPLVSPRITRKFRADHPNTPAAILHPPLPMTGRLPEHTRRVPPQPLQSPQPQPPPEPRLLARNKNWSHPHERSVGVRPINNRRRQVQLVPPQTPLSAAHHAALLQLAIHNFTPVPKDSPMARRPPPSWNPTRTGPQAITITEIRYGHLTDAAAAGERELDVLWVNVGTQTATTVHRDLRCEDAGVLFTTALYTSVLEDSHPLLLRAPDYVPPVRGFPLGYGHALLPETHPLMKRAKAEFERRANGPLVWTAKPLLENPAWRVEGDVERSIRTEIGRKLWGKRRGRIGGGEDRGLDEATGPTGPITGEEIVDAIVSKGGAVSIQELLNVFGRRLGEQEGRTRKEDWVKLVKQVAMYDVDKMVRVRGTPVEGARSAGEKKTAGEDGPAAEDKPAGGDKIASKDSPAAKATPDREDKPAAEVTLTGGAKPAGGDAVGGQAEDRK